MLLDFPHLAGGVDSPAAFFCVVHTKKYGTFKIIHSCSIDVHWQVVQACPPEVNNQPYGSIDIER